MTECLEILNLRHLRMIGVAASLNSVTAAAYELNTSQPAVTQAITKIEEDLGASIFERKATGTFPTQVGKLWIRRVNRFFEIMDQAMSAVVDEGQKIKSSDYRAVEQMITGTHVRSLIATSDAGMAEESARQLGVSTTTLYRSVRELERVVQRRLFDRTANGPIYNATGQELNLRFRLAIREIEFGRSEFRLALGNDEPEIIVGVLPMSGSSELASAIKMFSKLNPKARVRILYGDYAKLLNDLRHGRSDMLFGLLRKPEWEIEVEEEMLFRDSYCVAVRSGHALARCKSVSPKQLENFDWIVPAVGTPRRKQIEKLFSDASRKPKFLVETSSLTTTRALLIDSDLVTVLSLSEARLDAKIGTLSILSCSDLDPIPPKGITTRANWLPTDTHNSFIKCLRKSTLNVKQFKDSSATLDAKLAS